MSHTIFFFVKTFGMLHFQVCREKVVKPNYLLSSMSEIDIFVGVPMWVAFHQKFDENSVLGESCFYFFAQPKFN